MENDIDKLRAAWKQEIDSFVLKAATEDWGEYPSDVQSIIETEVKDRGLWEKVLCLRGEKTNEAWKQETDFGLIKAATEDWDEYPSDVQSIIETEVKHRGLRKKILFLRAEKTEFHKFNKYANIYIFVIIVISLWFLGFACSKYYIDAAKGFGSQLGDLTAKAFWIGIIIFFIYTSEKKIKTSLKGKKKTLLVYFTILCLIANYKSINILIDASQYTQREKMAEDFRTVVENVYTGKPVTQEFTKEEYGELALPMQIMVQCLNKIEQERGEMLIEIDKCDLASIWKLETLTEPQRLSILKKNVYKAEQILQRYQERAMLIDNEFKQRILSAPSISEELKIRFLEGFTESRGRGAEKITDLFEIQKEFIKGCKNLINFMESHNYKIKEDKIFFYSEEDGKLYNSYIFDLASLSEKESALVDKLRQEAYTEIIEKINAKIVSKDTTSVQQDKKTTFMPDNKPTNDEEN